jgi:hypothetical protein
MTTLAQLREAHGPITAEQIAAANDSMLDAMLAAQEKPPPAVRVSLD